jgi:parvulin-like peptidyl-prolyl isomerase
LALYKFYQYNTFLYRITQVVPFPIARADGAFVNYESYLFEVRHRVHYFETQQQANFNDPANRQQLLAFRKQSLNQVINEAYVKKLAASNKVSVSDKEVDSRINEVRDQNRLGSNNKVFADVLRSYWGWSIGDFKRSLKQEILAEKVVAKLDVPDTQRANAVLAQLRAGADFSTLAKQASDDAATKAAGGDYGFGITRTNPNIPPSVISELFKLKPGQVSNVINTGATLEVLKVTQSDGTTLTASHISFNLKDINVYINGLKAKKPAHYYVKF